MANNSKTADDEDSGSIWKTLGAIILVFIAFGILIAIINPDDSGTKSEGQEAGLEDLDSETKQEYYAIEVFVAYVEPLLSDTGRKNLNTVWDYIQEDPSVLKLDYYEHPSEIRAAYEDLKKELTYTYGSGERPDISVSVGDRYTVEGTLEKTDQETPIGPLYMVIDMNTNADLYFSFDQATQARIEDTSLVGQNVTIEIEITEVDGTNVSYKVIEGPVLTSDAGSK